MKPLAIRSEAVDIKCPLISPKDGERNPIRITCATPLQYRKAVYRIACFFRREFGYDVVQYGDDGYEDDWDHVAFLWIHPETEGNRNFRIPCIGAACFRLRSQEGQEGYALQWVWFHPYFRRKGLLSASWTGFKAEFGDFKCEYPLSEAMASFIDKHR